MNQLDEIIQYLLIKKASMTSGNITLNSLPNGEVGLYISDQITLTEAITKLVTSFYGYWFFGTDGKFNATIFDVPQSSGYKIGNQRIIGKLTAMEVQDIYDTVDYTYRPNYHPSDDIAASVSQLDTKQLKADSFTGTKTDSTITSAYPTAKTTTHDTLYFTNTDANTVATRILACHRQIRYRVKLTTPYDGTQLVLGGAVELEDTSLDGDYVIVGLSTKMMEGNLVYEVELWG
jgi:hypothetical protein